MRLLIGFGRVTLKLDSAKGRSCPKLCAWRLTVAHVNQAGIDDHPQPVVFLGDEKDPDLPLNTFSVSSESELRQVAKERDTCGAIRLEGRVPIKSNIRALPFGGQMPHLGL